MGKQSRRKRNIGTEAREETKSSGPNVVLIGIGVVVVAVVAYFGLTRGAPAGMATLPVEVDLEGNELAALGSPQVTGNPNAPISIIEFGDFQCGACQAFHRSVKPQMDATYIETGEAEFNFYDFPLTALHAHAFVAARAGRCAADQGQFWMYHDMLFGRQQEWGLSVSPVGIFEDFAGEIGLDSDEFSSCVRSDRFADVVSAQMKIGQQLQVTGTPTIIVSAPGPNGTVIRRVEQWNEFSSLQAAVEAVRAEIGMPSSDAGEAMTGAAGGMAGATSGSEDR